jgi:chromosome segregation ATPase
MLLQIKASLSHGEWLPWLNDEIESGRLEVKSTQARVYMRVAANKQRGVYLPETTSIRAALELLSDKEPDEKQGELIDIETERQAREKAEQQAESERQRRESAERVLLEAQQRAREFGQESNERRLKIMDLEEQVIRLEKQPKPEPEIVEKIPDDYESVKRKAAESEKELAKLKAAQTKLVADQVKAKLQGYQSEVDKMEHKKAVMQDQVDRMKVYMESLNSESKRIEVHRDVIEKSRLGLISLAAFLSDEGVMNDADTRDRWLKLAKMHGDAERAIQDFSGNNRYELNQDQP